jgi:hypothetical protein
MSEEEVVAGATRAQGRSGVLAVAVDHLLVGGGQRLGEPVQRTEHRTMVAQRILERSSSPARCNCAPTNTEVARAPRQTGPSQADRFNCRMPGQVTGRGGPCCRLRPEVLVDLADRHRSLADRGGHPFDRAATHVSRREHTGLAGLQHHRLTLRSHLIAIGV